MAQAEGESGTVAGAAGWTLVVATSQNDVIGCAGHLPWHLRSDLQRFKRLTMGHCLLMGRKTYDSIGRPLPGRQTIVLSRRGMLPENSSAAGQACCVARQLSEVPALVEPGRQVMVVGGAEIYQAALDRCGTLWLTRVQAEIAGDVYLPTIDWSQWRMEVCEPLDAGPHDDWPTEFQIWKRRVPLS